MTPRLQLLAPAELAPVEDDAADRNISITLRRRGPVLTLTVEATDASEETADQAHERETPEQPAASEPEAAHSEDFRCVKWLGHTYSLTKPQGRVVRVLWEAWVKGIPDVADHALLLASGSASMRMAVEFRSSPAWGTLVVPGDRRGTHRLAGPDDDDAAKG